MTVGTIMTGKTPSATYAGQIMTDDFIFAIDIAPGGASAVSAYVVAREAVTSHGAVLNPVTADKSYLSGAVTVKTGTKRQFTLPGDVTTGDAFQDFCLSHDIKFGKGTEVQVPYVYFNMLTGKGEQGNVNIIVNEDETGDAQNNAGFSIDLFATEEPTAYTYSAV